MQSRITSPRFIQLGVFDPCGDGEIRYVDEPAPDSEWTRRVFARVIRGFNKRMEATDSIGVIGVFPVQKESNSVTAHSD